MSLRNVQFRKCLVLHAGMANAQGSYFPKIIILDAYHSKGESDSEYREQCGWLPRTLATSRAFYQEVYSSSLPAVWNLNIKTEKVNNDGSSKSVVVGGEYLEDAFIGDTEDVLQDLQPIIQQRIAEAQPQPSQSDRPAVAQPQPSQSDRPAQPSQSNRRSSSSSSSRPVSAATS